VTRNYLNQETLTLTIARPSPQSSMFHRQTPSAIAPLIGLIIVGLAMFAMPEQENPRTNSLSGILSGSGTIVHAGNFNGEGLDSVGASRTDQSLATPASQELASGAVRVRISWKGCGLGISFGEKRAGMNDSQQQGLAREASLQDLAESELVLWELDLPRQQDPTLQTDRRLEPPAVGLSRLRSTEYERDLPDPTIVRLQVLDQETGTVPHELAISWRPASSARIYDTTWRQLPYESRNDAHLLTLEPGPIRLRITANGYFGIETEVVIASGFNELIFELNAMVRADLVFVGRTGVVPVDLAGCSLEVVALGRQGQLRTLQGQSLFFTTDGSYSITIADIPGYSPVTAEINVNREAPLQVRIPLHGR